MTLLSAIVEWSLRNRIIILGVTLLFVALGVHSALKLPIDAVPDVTNVQVQVITAAPALWAEKPCAGSILMIRMPIVRMIRQPPL